MGNLIHLSCLSVVLLCAATLLMPTAATMDPMPEPKPLSPASGLKAVNVFWRGEQATNGKVYPCIRIPSLVAAEAGGVESLIAFAECRSWTGDGCEPKSAGEIETSRGAVDICMKSSSDDGATWGDLQVVATGAGQPTAVFDSQQEAIVLQIDQNGHISQLVSKDLGATWTDPVVVDGSWNNGTGSSVGPGRGIQLSANSKYPNRILFIGHHGAYQEDYVWYSDDGQTYNVSAQPLMKMDEAQLVELPNGDVMANMRNNHLNPNCSCRAISISQDGGATWGEIYFDNDLPDPVCMASIVRNDDYFYFANPGNAHGRVNGTVKRSDDGATTWGHAVEVNPGGDFAYSCLSETSDESTMGLLWETSADSCMGPSCRIVFSPIEEEAFQQV